MTDRLPTGAYIINNRKTGTVIHIGGSEVVVFDRDEHRHRDRQIWWVESLPDYDDDQKGGGVYNISNISVDKALQGSWEKAPGRVGVFQIMGEPWMRWRIRKVNDDTEGEFYTITNIWSGTVMDIKGEDNPAAGSQCCTSIPADTNLKQQWQFITPILAVPPGWVQIRNASASNFLLQQTHFSSPPFLVPETKLNSKKLNHTENWATQWTFILPLEQPIDAAHRTWVIRNRLTRGLLSNQVELYKDTIEITVNASNPVYNEKAGVRKWMLELTRDGFWKIKNARTEFLLEQGGPVEDCKDVVMCVEKDTTRASATKLWEIL
ncbi:hypothetical protein RUND412_001721 [Rhizina undulata]